MCVCVCVCVCSHCPCVCIFAVSGEAVSSVSVQSLFSQSVDLPGMRVCVTVRVLLLLFCFFSLFPVCLSVCLFVSVSLSLSLSLSLCHSGLPVFVCPSCLCLSVAACLSRLLACLPVPFFLCLGVCLSFLLSLCFACLPISVHLSLSLLIRKKKEDRYCSNRYTLHVI